MNSILKAVIQALADSKELQRWFHLVRATTYTEIGRGRIQTTKPLEDGAAVVIYVNDKHGTFWARRLEDFEDGRFEKVPEHDDTGS